MIISGVRILPRRPWETEWQRKTWHVTRSWLRRCVTTSWLACVTPLSSWRRAHARLTLYRRRTLCDPLYEEGRACETSQSLSVTVTNLCDVGIFATSFTRTGWQIQRETFPSLSSDNHVLKSPRCLVGTTKWFQYTVLSVHGRFDAEVTTKPLLEVAPTTSKQNRLHRQPATGTVLGTAHISATLHWNRHSVVTAYTFSRTAP